jgi:hypothetical protein
MTIPNIIVNSIHGPMIVNENDQYIGQSIRQLGAWAQDDIDLIASFCDIILANKPKMVLYDVGANIGSHTVALAKKYGLTWGGDYKNRKDEMHFEVNIGPAKVAELITKLGLDGVNNE